MVRSTVGVGVPVVAGVRRAVDVGGVAVRTMLVAVAVPVCVGAAVGDGDVGDASSPLQPASVASITTHAIQAATFMADPPASTRAGTNMPGGPEARDLRAPDRSARASAHRIRIRASPYASPAP